MQGRQEKYSASTAKTLVKKEDGWSVKSNGAAVKEADLHRPKKELIGKSSTNGAKVLVKKETHSSVKSNGTYPKEGNSSSDKKKEVSSGVKTIIQKTVNKTKVTATKTEEKKVKKVFTLPGQKHEPPEERDPLRIFYESLHEQIPESEMAEFWMMEHGLLDAQHAQKALERKQRRQQSERNGTPIKFSTAYRDVNINSVKKSPLLNGKSSKLNEQKGKRKREYSSDDDDFIARPVQRRLQT